MLSNNRGEKNGDILLLLWTATDASTVFVSIHTGNRIEAQADACARKYQ
ncbi:hypothetical protein ACR78F_06585 [Sphingobacterium spiritivorum]